MILDFLESHPVLVNGKLRPGEGPQTVQNLWEELAGILNAVGNGPEKSADGWKKVWKYGNTLLLTQIFKSLVCHDKNRT